MPKKRMQSYEMIPDRFKERYFSFYQELYNDEHSVLDLKTKELIAIAASLNAGCHGCFKGHVIKAARNGATRDEIGEAIAVALAIAGAAVVDRTDIANFDFDLVQRLWENNGKDEAGEELEEGIATAP